MPTSARADRLTFAVSICDGRGMCRWRFSARAGQEAYLEEAAVLRRVEHDAADGAALQHARGDADDGPRADAGDDADGSRLREIH